MKHGFGALVVFALTMILAASPIFALMLTQAARQLGPKEVFSRLVTFSGFAVKMEHNKRDGLSKRRRIFQSVFALGNAGSLNLDFIRHPVITLDTSRTEQTIELDPGVPTTELQFRLSGSLTTTGATPGAAVLNDDAMQRLISTIRVEYGSEVIVKDIPLRDMHQIWLHHVNQQPTQDPVTQAELVAAAGTYPFTLHSGIPFATRWLRRPWDTHLPALGGTNKLRLIITFNQAKTQAGDGAGTGSFVKTAGTTVAYTFGVAPTLEVFQYGFPRAQSEGKPLALRYYSQFTTDPWSAAQDPLREVLQSAREFDFHLLRTTFNANNDLANYIDTLSFKSSRETFIDRMPLGMMHASEAVIFPAVNANLGYLGIPWARDGMLTNLVRPSEHDNLRYEFKTLTPASGQAKITYTAAELVRQGG